MHNLFLVYLVNLYMFRAYPTPPSGGTSVCIQQLVLIILFRWISVVVVGLEFVNLYMFRAHLGQSSGGTTVCIQQMVPIILFRCLSVVLVGLEFVKLYMFRAYLGQSSGGTTVFIQQLVLIILFRWLSVVLVGLENCNPTRTTDSHLKRIISTICCIHKVVQYHLMMGLDTPETYRGWRNILRISCASRRFFFVWLYRDARSTKHNIYSTSGGMSEWKNALTAATVNMTICWHMTQLRMERSHFSTKSIKFYHRASHSRRW